MRFIAECAKAVGGFLGISFLIVALWWVIGVCAGAAYAGFKFVTG